jgi:hypothetical protein
LTQLTIFAKAIQDRVCVVIGDVEHHMTAEDARRLHKSLYMAFTDAEWHGYRAQREATTHVCGYMLVYPDRVEKHELLRGPNAECERAADLAPANAVSGLGRMRASVVVVPAAEWDAMMRGDEPAGRARQRPASDPGD